MEDTSMKFPAIVLVMVLGQSPSPFLPQEEQEAIERAWKETGITWPQGMKFYSLRPASQMLAIDQNNGNVRDWYFDSFNLGGELNSNRRHPWRAPGGLDKVTGWRSSKGVLLPEGKEIEYYLEDVVVPNAGRKLPRVSWDYPNGTMFADVLSNEKGELFEIRGRTKKEGKWVSRILWFNESTRPKGYSGLTQSCSSCHDKAGTSEMYGITVRGSDTVFSLHPIDPATISDRFVPPFPRLSAFLPLRKRN